MKRIGFIDHDLNNYHANTFEEAIHSPLKDRGFRVAACYAKKDEEGKKWAAQKNIPFVSSIKDLSGKVDFLMILAPSNPETHLELVKEAVALKIPIYVDKTFAPDLPTAKQIFAIADKAGVPIISSSALRYADEFSTVKNETGANPILQVQTYGGGKSYHEYCIHPLEMAVTMMGWQVRRVRRVNTQSLNQIELFYQDGRVASVFVYPHTDVKLKAVVTTASQHRAMEIQSSIFVNTMSAIMDFFLAGKETIDRRETLMIREIMDLCEKPNIHEGLATSL